MNISRPSRHSIPNFADSFDFRCLTNFATNIKLSSEDFSLVWVNFNLHLKEPMDNNSQIVNKTWVGMSTSLLIFIYSHSVTCKNADLNAGTLLELIPKKNCLKFPTLKFAILPFSHANTLARLRSWNYFFEPDASKWFILTQRTQNL